jgi:hypothetical protein
MNENITGNVEGVDVQIDLKLSAEIDGEKTVLLENVFALKQQLEMEMGPPDDETLKAMSWKEVLDALDISSGYEQRYDLILKLHAGGKVLFDGDLNPYTDGRDTTYYTPEKTALLAKYQYIGNGKQNAKLKRQIIWNKDLFADGRLPAKNVRKWRVE